jgi:hypothetical protein
MNKFKFILPAVTFICVANLTAQTDSLTQWGDSAEYTDRVTSAFRTSRIINTHSVDNPARGVLLFMIQHRFGRLNSGPYELFGLDLATTRFGLEYGITKRLSAGIGRSSYQKTFDGFIKYKILVQSNGKPFMPVTISYCISASVTSLKSETMGFGDREIYFRSRLAYIHQLLIARKFGNVLSMQFIPTLVHKNLVASPEDNNDVYSFGIGGRIILTSRISILAEYFYTPENQLSYGFNQPFSVALEIKTSGHVFQLHFSNAQPFFDSGIVTDTHGSWLNGDIYFGFGISRLFQIN